jgi:hypothetical protein
MAKKLVDRFIENQEINGRDGLYTRLSKRLPVRFGVPQASHRLMIRRTILDEKDLSKPCHTDHILVCHSISTPGRDLIGLNLGGATGAGIEIAANDWLVTGIPRSYTRDFLTKDVQWWAMDFDADNIGNPCYGTDKLPKGGILLKSIFIKDEPKNLLAWSIVLREWSDRASTAISAGSYGGY